MERPNFSLLAELKAKRFMRYCNKRVQTDSEFSIAQTVMRHTGDILNISQEQLAEESHLSEASVSRFFRRCGFESFWEFKTLLAQFLADRRFQKTQEYLKKYGGMSEDQIAQGLFARAEQNLQETKRTLDLPKLRAIAQMMQEAKTIYFVGDIRDIYCFYSLQMDLMSRGKTAYFYFADENNARAPIEMGPEVLVCIVSASLWYEKEAAEICEKAKAKQARTVCMTQGKPKPEIEAGIWYAYGVPGSVNDGYYSLPLLAELLRKLLYKYENE